MKKSTLTLEECLAVVKGYGFENISEIEEDIFSFQDENGIEYDIALSANGHIVISFETELFYLKDTNDLKEHLDSILESTK